MTKPNLHYWRGNTGLYKAADTLISSPSEIADWFAYYSANGMDVAGAGDLGTDDWLNDDTVVSGGPNFGLTNANLAKLGEIQVVSGITGATFWCHNEPVNDVGNCNDLTAGELVTLQALQSGSLASFSYINALTATNNIFAAASQFANRYLALGVQASGAVTVTLDTPKAASSGQYEIWFNSSDDVVTAGAWHTFVLSQPDDTGGMNLYVDGVDFPLTYANITAGANGDIGDWIGDISTGGNKAKTLNVGSWQQSDQDGAVGVIDMETLDYGCTSNGSTIDLAGAIKWDAYCRDRYPGT